MKIFSSMVNKRFFDDFLNSHFCITPYHVVTVIWKVAGCHNDHNSRSQWDGFVLKEQPFQSPSKYQRNENKVFFQ